MSKLCIAVIDDDTDVLALMAEILGESGYRTVTGANAGEVEHLVASQRPDLLILDVRLPGELSGVPLLRTLRGMPVAAELPIVVATADRTFLYENAGTLKALGCETLEKPFDIESLLDCVAALLPAPDRSLTGRYRSAL
jgi:DNA-binding response OmpR family regulator